MLASMMKSRPRNWPIVRALAGDSTITSALPPVRAAGFLAIGGGYSKDYEAAGRREIGWGAERVTMASGQHFNKTRSAIVSIWQSGLTFRVPSIIRHGRRLLRPWLFGAVRPVHNRQPWRAGLAALACCAEHSI